MATALKIRLNQLYKVSAASETTPNFYTPATIEIVSATSDVTICATTNPDFDGAYNELPVCTSEAKAGEVYQTDVTRSVRFISFSCLDSAAEIYVAGFKLEPVEA